VNSWEENLRKRYPEPETDGIDSFYFSLDGGGREIVIDVLRGRTINVMLEIGCFLCGSTIQWLEARQELKVVGIDPWQANFASILERYSNDPVFSPCFEKIVDKNRFIESVRAHGPFASAVANTRRYRDRFFPVRASSPTVLHELVSLGLKPQLIYFDSNKLMDDLNVCNDLFPDAILCGDDWTWGANQGFPVQMAVKRFCQQQGASVTSKRATWIIDPR